MLEHLKFNCLKNKNDNKNNGKRTHDLVCVVFESILVDNDTNAWWIDFGSTRHVSKGQITLS